MRPLLISMIVLTAVFSIYPNASAEITFYGPMGSVTEKFLSPKIDKIFPVINGKISGIAVTESASEKTRKAASEGMKDTMNHLNAVRYMMSCA